MASKNQATRKANTTRKSAPAQRSQSSARRSRKPTASDAVKVVEPVQRKSVKKSAREIQETSETGEQNMRRMSRVKSNGNGHYTRRAADYLHEGIDRLAERGARLERRLQDGYQRVDKDAHEIYSTVRGSVHEHPWMAVGSSAAIGFIIGFLSSSRR